MNMRPLKDTISDMITLRDLLDCGDSHATVLEAIDWLETIAELERELKDAKGSIVELQKIIQVAGTTDSKNFLKLQQENARLRGYARHASACHLESTSPSVVRLGCDCGWEALAADESKGG